MATQSIYETLATRTTETSVPAMGKDEQGKTILVPHTIPENLFPSDKVFENKDDLIEWADERDYLFPLLQMGVQSGLIDIRAKFKACKKEDTWTPEYGQANVDKHEWTVAKRPNQNGKVSLDKARFADCLAMIAKLTDAGMDFETIKNMTVGIYGEQVVDAIIETLS